MQAAVNEIYGTKGIMIKKALEPGNQLTNDQEASLRLPLERVLMDEAEK
ncbi:MAG: hypothetical protein GY874_16215 [Desulfobacteraceae bacterium]|nr:hypothetical protein [Desulfobacteraceae bacterium]